jgi:hypothetical protein
MLGTILCFIGCHRWSTPFWVQQTRIEVGGWHHKCERLGCFSKARTKCPGQSGKKTLVQRLTKRFA